MDGGGNDRSKFFLRRKPRSYKGISKVDGGPEMQALQIEKDAKYLGLKDICADIDTTPPTPYVDGMHGSNSERCQQSVGSHGGGSTF